MTTKHTPGPWMIAVCPATRTPIVKAGRLTICSMAEGDADEHLSDQMLIAAAPELLAAIKGLMTWCAGDVLDLPEVNAARAAIAKAQGE